MPLKWQNVRVPFGGGIDTKTDEKQVVPGKLLTLENGVFHETGAIRKRNGFENPCSFDTVDGDTIEGGNAIYRRGKELVITDLQTRESDGRVAWEDGRMMHSHGPDENEWKTIGTREPCRLDVETIYRPTGTWVIPDVALAEDDKYIAYSWLGLKDPADSTSNRHAHMSVIELTNDVILIDNWVWDAVPLNNVDAEGVHVVGLDNEFHTWIAVPASNEVYLAQTNCDTLSAAGNAVLKFSDLHEDMIWDVCTIVHDTHGISSVVAYKDTDGNWNIRWFDIDGTNYHTQGSAIGIENAITCFSAYDRLTTSTKLIVAYQNAASNDVVGVTFSSDNSLYSAGDWTAIVLPDLTVCNLTGCKDTAADHYAWATQSHVRIYAEICCEYVGNPCQYNNYIMQANVEFDGTGATELNSMWSCGLASKAWEHESKARVWVVHDSSGHLGSVALTYSSTAQNTYFLRSTQGDGTTPGGGNQDEKDRTDARCLGGQAHGISDRQSLSAVVSPEENEYVFAGLRKDVLVNTEYSGTTFDSIVGIKTTFGQIAQPSTELGPCVQTGGGYVGLADGRFQELGFHLYPMIVQIQSTGGSSPTDANWMYCAVYEWTDREGQIHRSAPSIPVAHHALNDDAAVSVLVRNLHFGDPRKLNEVRIVLYRTKDGPGTVFYRLPTPVHELNDIAWTTTTLNDGPGPGPAYPDAVLINGATLYTTGGVLENMCPPASSIMNVRQDRIFLVPDEDRTAIWFSKIKRNEVGTSFCEEFTTRITDGGEITALADMDTREIVFKENQIRAFSGDGPNDLGIGGFGNDYLITSDVGCVDRASVVWTDKGLMFKSHKGIYLLGRNLQVSYIGAPVEDFNQFAVLKATLVETKNQVRFLLDGSQMLVYDYLVDQWSVFKAPQADPEVESYWDTVDSAMWQGSYVMIEDTGLVHVEGTDFTDGTDDHYIPLTIETAWIKLTGLQGYQRVRWAHFLGDIAGQCTLTIEAYRDYIETAIQTSTITVDANYTGLGGEHQVRVKPVYQKGEAYKFRIYDAEDATWGGTQEGYALSEIMLEVGLKKGLHKLRAEKTR